MAAVGGRLGRSGRSRPREQQAGGKQGEDIEFAAGTKHTVLRRAAKVQGAAAWIMSVNRARGRYRDRPVDFTTNETMVLTRVHNRWRISHIHWSFDDRAPH